MGEEPTILTFGNKFLSEGTLDRPRVTFVLFAYNQERYIRDAINGAFSQTYSPLEIIISDDCSTDQTFDIMKDLAANYNGQHCVQVIRNATNLGLVNHLLARSKGASGKFLVVAAGDDISYPNRVERLTENWLSTKKIAITSNYDEITQDGDLVGANLTFRTALPGFAAAYERIFWSELPLSNGSLISEDGLARAIMKIRNLEISHVAEALVAYRTVSNSLSGRDEPRTAGEIWERELKLTQRGEELMERISYLIQNAYSPLHPVDQGLFDRLVRDWVYGKVLKNFWRMRLQERVFAVFTFSDGRIVRFALSRLFGRKIFVFGRLLLSAVRE
ncbi:glycosyltransferase [Flavimaricola sp.]|nr:glycosyltransferase [Flavimaricola sp.]MDA9020354.1 glycosyltransferase [Flavimaricola sp.]